MSSIGQNPRTDQQISVRVFDELLADSVLRRFGNNLEQLARRHNIKPQEFKDWLEWVDSQIQGYSINAEVLEQSAKSRLGADQNIAGLMRYFHQQNSRLKALAQAEYSPLIKHSSYQGLDGDNWQLSYFSSPGFNNLVADDPIQISGDPAQGLTVLEYRGVEEKPRNKNLFMTMAGAVKKFFTREMLEKKADIRLEADVFDQKQEPLTYEEKKNVVYTKIGSFVRASLAPTPDADLFKKYSRKDKPSPFLEKTTDTLLDHFLAKFNAKIFQSFVGACLKVKITKVKEDYFYDDFDPRKYISEEGEFNERALVEDCFDYYCENLRQDPEFLMKEFFKGNFQNRLRYDQYGTECHGAFMDAFSEHGGEEDIRTSYNFCQLLDRGKSFDLITNGDYFPLQISKDPERTKQNLSKILNDDGVSRGYKIRKALGLQSKAALKKSDIVKTNLSKKECSGLLLISRSLVAGLDLNNSGLEVFYRQVIKPFVDNPGDIQKSQRMVANALKSYDQKDSVAVVALLRNIRGEKTKPLTPSVSIPSSPSFAPLISA